MSRMRTDRRHRNRCEYVDRRNRHDRRPGHGPEPVGRVRSEPGRFGHQQHEGDRHGRGPHRNPRPARRLARERRAMGLERPFRHPLRGVERLRQLQLVLRGRHLGSLIDTDGNRRRIPAPKPINQTQRRLAKAQRKEARQQQGSKRYQKQKQRIARLYAKARHQLDDYQNKQALRIVRETQAIGLETLNVHGMSRIHGRSVLTVAPSRFVMKLEHKAQQYGRQIRHIGRFQPSTRLCSQCGHHVKGGIPENIRVWKCAECHTTLDRDSISPRRDEATVKETRTTGTTTMPESRCFSTGRKSRYECDTPKERCRHADAQRHGPSLLRIIGIPSYEATPSQISCPVRLA